ncbi:MAG TPA: thermonuclease family protein [Stellaceae bacterium]|nr:thermonuclease family protein [Stellaceae bacterium]
MRLARVILPSLVLSLGLAAAPALQAAQLADAASTPPADLPTVEVKPRPVHGVPDDTPAPAPVTLPSHDRGTSAETAARRPSPPAPAQTAAVIISGAARVDNSVSLKVHGRVVPLFGVRAPASGDRCGAAPGPSPRACGEVAREALASRLSANTTVSCRVPPGQRGGRAAAVCLDSTGVDLAGFLVGAGFALADPAQSYDYVGAEGIARSYRRGLWRYR